MRNKSCGNGSKNCVAFRNLMRNGNAIGNPSLEPLTIIKVTPVLVVKAKTILSHSRGYRNSLRGMRDFEKRKYYKKGIRETFY